VCDTLWIWDRNKGTYKPLTGKKEQILRFIDGILPSDLKAQIGTTPVDKAYPFEAKTYRELMNYIARLAYLNKDHLLFFRGQNDDYRNRAGSSTCYPTIYRGDYLPAREVLYRFEILDQASKMLADEFKKGKIAGYPEIRRKKYIRWSILQHYEVCQTPLLDFTHSVRVACSFAQLRNNSRQAYIFVFGMPYLTNRISINSEHDLVNVRLLSICPPDAMRPYYQEGYLLGTADITTDYDSKTELDFKNRLIAKFAIPSSSKFWGSGFSSIPETVLYPKKDTIGKLCESLQISLKSEIQHGEMGEFLKIWTKLEENLLESSKKLQARAFSAREAISVLAKHKKLPKELANELETLRNFRNQLVHKPETIKTAEIKKSITRLSSISQKIK